MTRSRPSSADAVTSVPATLPAQVSPPEFALSGLPAAALQGVDAVAYAVQPGTDAPLLSADADALGAEVGLDLMAVLDAGAYGATESMPLFLSHPTPPEIAVRSGEAWVARPRIEPEAWLGRQIAEPTG